MLRIGASSLALFMVLAGGPANACVADIGGPWMRAGLAEKDIETVETAGDIYLATVIDSQNRGQFFVLRPTEPIIGGWPEVDVRSPARLWTSCGFIPMFYADWDQQLLNGETAIVLTNGQATAIRQIAALDTPDGERLLALARARQERLTQTASPE